MDNKTNQRMYTWNRNARTHGDNIAMFAKYALFASTIASVGVFIVGWAGRYPAEGWLVTLVLGTIFTNAVTFVLVLAIMCSFYHLLNEQQAKEKSPPPHRETMENTRKIPGRVRGKSATIHFD